MNRHIRIIEHVFKRTPKKENINIEYWVQNDSLNLAEGICLVFEREAPLEELPAIIVFDIDPQLYPQKELIKEEYNQVLGVYHSATRSIDSGDLKGGINAKKEYWVNTDDLLRWCYERNIGNENYIQFLIKKRKEAKASRKSLPPKIKATTKNNLPPSDEILDENSKKIYYDVIAWRRQMTEMTLDKLFSNDKKNYIQYAPLIEESELPEKEFTKYNKKGTPKTLKREHQTRAVCKVLKAVDPKLKISDLADHWVLVELQLLGEKPCSSTFRDWMNREKIYDRQPKTHKPFRMPPLSPNSSTPLSNS